MKKINLKKEEQTKQFIESQIDSSSAGDVDLRTSQSAQSNEVNPTPKQFMAFHPRDHWEFAKDLDHKNAVIFVHGHNYAPNDTSAAEFVLNECLSFYADLPYLVIPFLWPCEGTKRVTMFHMTSFSVKTFWFKTSYLHLTCTLDI